MNAKVLRGLRTRTFDRLNKCGRRWADEVPVALWSLCMTPNRAAGETLFASTCGAEEVLPTRFIYGSPRVIADDENNQKLRRHDDVDLLEENHSRAVVRIARYQQVLRRYHSRNIRSRGFEEGDLVLHRLRSGKGTNKLTPKWEGSYRVVQVTRFGTVHLETEDGVPVQNSWNIEN